MTSKGNELIYSTEVRKPKRIFKIIVVGDSNVGKTCLTYRFCEGKFPSRTEATIGVDFRERTIHIGTEEIKLQLWDTAGQERFRRSMLPHYYRNVHAVVFTYDVTKPSSFNSLPAWVQECDEHYLTSEIPRLLVGNKCDEPALVPTQAAQRFADDHGMPHFETSAKDDSKADHVESIFLTLAHKLANSRPLMSRSFSGGGATTVGADESQQRGGAGFSLRADRSDSADPGEFDEDPCLC